MAFKVHARCIHTSELPPLLPFSFSSQWIEQERPNPSKRPQWLTALWVQSLRLWAASVVFQRRRRLRLRLPAPLHLTRRRWERQQNTVERENRGKKNKHHMCKQCWCSCFCCCSSSFSPTNSSKWECCFFLIILEAEAWCARFCFGKAIPVLCLASVCFQWEWYLET